MADRNPTDFQEPEGDQPARGMPDEGPKRRPTFLLIGAAIVAVVIVAAIIAAIVTDDDDVDDAVAGAQDPVLEDAMTVDEVIERFDELEGQEVTIGAGVGVGVAAHLATLGAGVEGPEQMLLVSENPDVGVFPQATRARVTGTLVTFDPDQAQQQLGIELDQDLAETYEGEPAILADSIHYFIVATDPSPAALDLLGERVTVLSAEVDSVVAPGLVRVAGGRLLIANADGVEEGDFLEATGTMSVVADEQLSAEHPDVASTIADLEESEQEDLLGLPVLVADEVEMIDAPSAE